MAGELSPDRLYYWDGERWASSMSPDGAWRWDGAAWRPSGAQPRRQSRAFVIGAVALIAATLIVGVSAALLTGRGLLSGWSALQHARSATTCSGQDAQPDQPLAEGDSLCGARLGPSFLTADCTESSGLPKGVDAWSAPTSGATWQPTEIAVDTTGCEMVASPDEELSVDSANVQPASVVAVADFTPLHRTGAVGAQLACTDASGCVDVALYEDGSYSLDEANTAGSWDNITSGQGGPFVPQVRPGKPNRLVVRMSGGKVDVFLNGVEVTHGTPRLPQSDGYVVFYVDDRDSTAIETVQLRHFYVFEAV